MKKNFTSISVVLDRSGSMNSCLEPTIEGFNAFIKEQNDKSVGDCVVSLHQFDDRYQTDYKVTPIAEAPELTTRNYVPRGMTALLDAIGRTIKELGKSLSDMDEDERPDTVIVAIMTDGHENASEEYTIRDISKMIAHQDEVYDWEFIFLGAGQDAIATAAGMSIEHKNAMTYTANERGTLSAFKSMSRGMRRKRMSKRDAYARGDDYIQATQLSKAMEVFSDDDRREQDDAES